MIFQYKMLIKERYELKEKIGSGSFGTVYKGYDTHRTGRNSNITIHWVPKKFERFVSFDEYDGYEYVGVDPLKIDSAILTDFLSEWKVNPKLTVEELNRRYEATKKTFARYMEFMQWWHKDGSRACM